MSKPKSIGEKKSFDEIVNIENLKTVKELGTVLNKCEKASKELKEKGLRLVSSLSELKQLYLELQGHHGREAVEPSEKLEKLKQVLSEWVEMYHVVAASLNSKSFTKEDEQLLNERYQNFSNFLTEIRNFHEEKGKEELVTEVIPVKNNVSELKSSKIDVEESIFVKEIVKIGNNLGLDVELTDPRAISLENYGEINKRVKEIKNIILGMGYKFEGKIYLYPKDTDSLVLDEDIYLSIERDDWREDLKEMLKQIAESSENKTKESERLSDFRHNFSRIQELEQKETAEAERKLTEYLNNYSGEEFTKFLIENKDKTIDSVKDLFLQNIVTSSTFVVYRDQTPGLEFVKKIAGEWFDKKYNKTGDKISFKIEKAKVNFKREVEPYVSTAVYSVSELFGKGNVLLNNILTSFKEAGQSTSEEVKNKRAEVIRLIQEFNGLGKKEVSKLSVKGNELLMKILDTLKKTGKVSKEEGNEIAELEVVVNQFENLSQQIDNALEQDMLLGQNNTSDIHENMSSLGEISEPTSEVSGTETAGTEEAVTPTTEKRFTKLSSSFAELFSKSSILLNNISASLKEAGQSVSKETRDRRAEAIKLIQEFNNLGKKGTAEFSQKGRELLLQILSALSVEPPTMSDMTPAEKKQYLTDREAEELGIAEIETLVTQFEEIPEPTSEVAETETAGTEELATPTTEKRFAKLSSSLTELFSKSSALLDNISASLREAGQSVSKETKDRREEAIKLIQEFNNLSKESTKKLSARGNELLMKILAALKKTGKISKEEGEKIAELKAVADQFENLSQQIDNAPKQIAAPGQSDVLEIHENMSSLGETPEESIPKNILEFAKDNPQIKVSEYQIFSLDFETLKPRLERLKEIITETGLTAPVRLEENNGITWFDKDSGYINLYIETDNWEERFREVLGQMGLVSGNVEINNNLGNFEIDNGQKIDEEAVREEIYQKEREKVERQIELERQKLNILRTQMLEASRDNLMDISRKENTGLFSKLFGKGSEIKLKAKESLEKYNSIFGQYLSVLNKMIELSGILSKEPEFVKNKIEEEIEEVRQLIDQSISDPKMSPSNVEYLKRVFDIFKTHFDKEEVKQQIVQLSQVIETKKGQFLNDVETQTRGKIELENKEQERSEKMAEFFQLEQVNYSITSLKELGCNNAEEVTTRILSNFINSHKNKEYVSNYFSDVNTLFANLLENGSINDDLSKFNVWLNERKVSEEQKVEFNQGIVGRVYEILRESVISNLERDRDGVINFSSLEKLIQQQVHREFLSIYRSNESASEGVIMLRPGTDIIEGLDLDKKQEEDEKTDVLDSTEQVIESKLRLVDSRKIGKENKYNFFIGQNLRLKNGSPVLVRDIQSDFIVVMEENGSLNSIFDDEIEEQLLATSGLKMSELSGSESKDKNQWYRLLKTAREKFISKSSDQEISWEYQDALKQYFEANQSEYEGDYKKFLNEEKQTLERSERVDVNGIMRILEQTFVSAIKSMNNKAKAENKRAEEKRNSAETPTSGKTNKADKTNQSSISVGTKTTITSSSPSNTSIRGGGGVVTIKPNVETATRIEDDNKNKIEFAGQLYDKKMSVYFEGEDKKTNIIISKVENSKISFRSSRKGYNVMSEEEWSRLLSYTELTDSLKKTDEQIRNMEIESTKKVKNSVADLFSEDGEEEPDDEKPKGQITPETAKLVEIGLIKTIKVGEGLKKLKDELIKKMTDVKTIDKNFVNSLSSEEKFLVSFVNGQRMNGFLEDKKGGELKEFYAYSNLDNCNLYIIRDSTDMGLIRHDKPVKNVGGILVEIENGEEHTVHYEIKNGKFILVRD